MEFNSVNKDMYSPKEKDNIHYTTFMCNCQWMDEQEEAVVRLIKQINERI